MIDDANDSSDPVRDRAAHPRDGMSIAERKVCIADALIAAALKGHDVPGGVRARIRDEVDQLARTTNLNPDQIAIIALGRGGYRAELKLAERAYVLTARRVPG